MRFTSHHWTLFSISLLALAMGCSGMGRQTRSLSDELSLQIVDVQAQYVPTFDAVVFDIEVEGDAAAIVPEPAGQLDGAPVLGYVIPTSLASTEVGFDAVDGIVALALTSHPDFDDTPLWDEDSNDRYDDDGAVYHAHWVVLQPDERAPAGLAVLQADATSQLPLTAPMDMYLDSPGFTIVEQGSNLQVLVPADRIQRTLDFSFGGLTAMMRVDASGEAPLLAVHEVISEHADGGMVERVADRDAAPAFAWPAPGDDDGTFDLLDASALYYDSLDTFVFSMQAAAPAATFIPEAVGSVDGAPVVGYVFPTDLAPAVVGFRGIEGILALAVTSHPDFDDTPLWDENLDRDWGNDGAVYHVHWVVLIEDDDSAGGLSVPSQTDVSLLPPTAPMKMYLDSPGFHAFAVGDKVHVLVPGWHLDGAFEFSFDAVTANMRVDASGEAPVLRVEEVLDVLSGDLSLPLAPERAEAQ